MLLNGAAFWLRQNLWGKWRLRRHLSTPPLNPGILAERALYTRIVQELIPESIRPSFKKIYDVGSKNGSYLPALSNLFPQAEIHGIELDGLRRYYHLHRRCDLAEAYLDEVRLEGRTAKYWVSDFLNLPLTPGPNLFCFFFPFVSVDPCLAWGLPRRFANFLPLLERATLNGGGVLTLHQGEWEAEIVENIFKSHSQNLGLQQNFIPSRILISPETFPKPWPGRYPLYGYFWKKPLR